MTEQDKISVDNGAIFYTTIRSARRKKTITLKVTSDGLKVYVPERMTRAKVRELVMHRADWIQQNLQVQVSRERAKTPRRFVSGETLYHLGQSYELKCVPGLKDIGLKQHYLEVPDVSEAEIRDSLTAWYRLQAQRCFNLRVAIYARHLGQSPSKVLVRDQKKRWGSCNTRGEIRLNWRLVMAPLPLIDYVVAHELCHLKHMNHSAAFWQCLEHLLPDYKALQIQLDQEGHRFYW
jgi:predicted metal-dependent hydrolase